MQKMMFFIVEVYFISFFVNDKFGCQVYEVCFFYLEIVRRDEVNKEVIVKELVVVVVKFIEVVFELKFFINQIIRQGMKGMIICFFNFYIWEKMLEYMIFLMGLIVKQVEYFFNCYIGNDVVRCEVYYKRVVMFVGIYV